MVCGLDFLFIFAVLLNEELPKMSAIKSLHLFANKTCQQTWLGITQLAASPNLTEYHTQISLCTAQCERRFHALRYSADCGFR